MPPISLISMFPAQLRATTEHTPDGGVLLAQATPPADGGTATDASPPPVASDAGTARDGSTAAPAPAAPAPTTPPPARLSVAQVTAAARERATILSDSHLLGSQSAAYQRDPSRYAVLRNAIVTIQYYVEGRHPDLFSSRPAILAWLREAQRTGDTVLNESLGNILAALGELTTDLNRARGEAMARQIAEIQQMIGRPVETTERSAPPPAAPPPPTGETSGTSTPPPPPGAGSSDEPSVSALHRRSERAVATAETACRSAPTSSSCVTARTRAVRATAAYSEAVCAATPRAAACSLARAGAEAARTARDEARRGATSTGSEDSHHLTEEATPPPPPPGAPTP